MELVWGTVYVAESVCKIMNKYSEKAWVEVFNSSKQARRKQDSKTRTMSRKGKAKGNRHSYEKKKHGKGRKNGNAQQSHRLAAESQTGIVTQQTNENMSA